MPVRTKKDVADAWKLPDPSLFRFYCLEIVRLSLGDSRTYRPDKTHRQSRMLAGLDAAIAALQQARAELTREENARDA